MNNHRPLLAAGTLIGIGMGGFVDGIIFHQVLQTHSMLSARLPQDELLNVKVSMVWDGLFHALTWMVTAVGISMLWRAMSEHHWRHSGKLLWGALLMGWGWFNLVEGLIDHYLLQVHHVVEREGLSMYDHVFVTTGFLLVLVGSALVRTGRRTITSS